MMGAVTFAEVTNLWVQTLAILSAGAWAVWRFIWLEYFSHEARRLFLRIDYEVETLSETDDHYLVGFKVDLKNETNKRVYLIHSQFFVGAGSVVKKEISDAEFSENTRRAMANEGYSRTMRSAIWHNYKPYAIGTLAKFGQWLDRGENLPASMCVWVPKDKQFMHFEIRTNISEKRPDFEIRWRAEGAGAVLDVRTSPSSGWISSGSSEFRDLFVSRKIVEVKAFGDFGFRGKITSK